LTFRQGDYPGGLNVIRSILKKMEEKYRRVSIRVIQYENDSISITGFEDGRRPQAKKCGWPPETGKGKKPDCSQEPPKRKSAMPTL